MIHSLLFEFDKAGQKFAGRAMAPDPSSAPVPPAAWVKDEPPKPVSITCKKNTCCYSMNNLPLLISKKALKHIFCIEIKQSLFLNFQSLSSISQSLQNTVISNPQNGSSVPPGFSLMEQPVRNPVLQQQRVISPMSQPQRG